MSVKRSVAKRVSVLPVSAPVLNGREREYVLDCVDSGWISSAGQYVNRFESAFAEFCGVRHAICCCNGTVALHLALRALDIGPGDEVIVPTLTFVATANAATYCGATPVFVDSEPARWNLDPLLVEAAITPRTKAIIAVHLHGQLAQMDLLQRIAHRHGVALIEDAAEAAGARLDGRPAGSIGEVGAFSFYGNKILTTGEGGMVTTNSDALAERIRSLRGQGVDPARRYWFPVIGYNYRMTNISAALGLAQTENAKWHLRRRREVAAQYRQQLQEVPGIRWQQPLSGAGDVFWMFSIVIDGCSVAGRDAIMQQLMDDLIETRPLFHPVHTLPPYRDPRSTDAFPVAVRLAAGGISLPSWGGLTEDDITYVCERLTAYLPPAMRMD